jgi:hypothetical protein
VAGDDLGIVRPLPPHRHRPPLRAGLSRLLAVAGVALLALQVPGVALGDHGGRPVGSVLACDRPVTPPRCTSVGDDLRHNVAFDVSLTDPLRTAMRGAMNDVYGPTRLVMVEQAEVTPTTDVIAFSADYGENGAAGWVYCPSDSPRGVNNEGDRWCRHQELHLNLNPRYGLFFDDAASRAHISCHELGHTLGLRHWGNPPQTDGPIGATCMNANTPNGPAGLHETDIDHINGYPYKVWPKTYGIEIARAPAAGPGMTAADGAMVEASQVETPTSLAELVAAADAVVVGRVTAVEPGRRFGPEHHALHYASVTVRVDELIAGHLAAASAQALTVEVPLFDGPEQTRDVRASMLDTQRLVFLRNKGTSAREAGLGAAEQAAEGAWFRLVTFGSEVIEHDGVAVVPPDDADLLGPLAGTSFDEALATVRAVAP